MGLTFADIQSMSREPSALYPPMDVLPLLTEYSDEEKAICERQIGFATRLKTSAYYVTEPTKSTELERYADRYRPSAAARPTLKRKDLHQPFFPQNVFEEYFNPKKKRKVDKKSVSKRVNLDDLGEDAEDQEKSDEDRSDVGSQAAEEDYDVDEEYDNDYAENYFDNGEGDDMDDLGGGGGGDEGGAAPAAVGACEGECIVGITNAFLGNYTEHIQTVFQDISQKISQKLLPQHPSTKQTMTYLNPIIDAYESASYTGMETAIFPSYFHGKCQRNGVDPPGCPNPDCPVVCGTPGSLVHFYPKLRYIAYNHTRSLLKDLSTPGSESYRKVENAVVKAAAMRRMVRWYRFGHAAAASGHPGPDMEEGEGPEVMMRNFPYVLKREENVKEGLKNIMSQVPVLLEKSCGGRATDDEGALPRCSWEDEMKEYILTFP
ncbi:hypothetical protein EW146_g1852 [Bondarzewia mesenterica]|uniref:Uncharacterized protein n=1 Tax=Bondarzewia mesenterica TaxID=1095465 RepID=A0A4S4M2D4_9AGAM|nr:hypothetical protein EW146_g1852 [Bondarzewia mesenterica]